ncbi:MAG: ATP-dependent Clp protease ATP-binding subunit [Elusimicrobia bacterium]|nr:ATP-dependent Clp protease ATP-binding subunit [Elusimicrobiota bacterium]
MADKLHKMTDWDRLKFMMEESTLDDKSKEVDETKLLDYLYTRIRGQDEIIKDVAKLVRLSWKKKERTKPICSLLLLGPTGTGKTELAKALTEFLFENEKDMIRFDCSELASGEMSKARLTGASSGYKGAETGGQLTRPIFANPKRLILFDEIEKAHPQVFDLLLQLLGDGRLTEQSTGKTADYTQCIVVLTSNAIAEEVAKVTAGMTDYLEILNAIKMLLAENKIFRPEILGRIDKVYQFKPLEGMIIAEIAIMKIERLAKEFGLEVNFVAPQILMQALLANAKISKFGIRELERILFDLFAPSLAELRDNKAKSASFDVDPSGKIIIKEMEIRKFEPHKQKEKPQAIARPDIDVKGLTKPEEPEKAPEADAGGGGTDARGTPGWPGSMPKPPKAG